MISVSLWRLIVPDILDIQRVEIIGAQQVLEWSGKVLRKNWDVIVALKHELDLSEVKKEMRVILGREISVNEGIETNQGVFMATEFAWWKQRIMIENKFRLGEGG